MCLTSEIAIGHGLDLGGNNAPIGRSGLWKGNRIERKMLKKLSTIAVKMRRTANRSVLFLSGWLLFSGSVSAQGITGRWATYGKEMWNGHRE